MKRFLIVLLVHPFSFGAELPVVELIPEDRIGDRHYVKVQNVEWKADHPKLGKSVMVHRAVPGKPVPPDDPLIDFAKTFGMTRVHEWKDVYPEFGTPEDGTIHYEFEKKDHDGVVWINPKTNYRYVRLLRSTDVFPRDENQDPIVRPMPSREKAIETCREWMKKFGIDEKNIARDPNGIAGLSVFFGQTTVGKWNKKLNRDVIYPIEMKVTFPHRIGDLPAYWNGMGGRYHFTLVDGGELRRAQWYIRPSEPLGEYDVLSRDELTAAILEGFCWSYSRVEVEKIEIIKIELQAYHARGNSFQKHFAPLWLLTVKGMGEDGKDVTLLIPALRQHRDKYPLDVEKAEE